MTEHGCIDADIRVRAKVLNIHDDAGLMGQSGPGTGTGVSAQMAHYFCKGVPS